jgi:hypothetical protein
MLQTVFSNRNQKSLFNSRTSFKNPAHHFCVVSFTDCRQVRRLPSVSTVHLFLPPLFPAECTHWNVRLKGEMSNTVQYGTVL